jgi:AcrR family transcriptional regulator
MPRNLKDHILQTASELFYRHGIKATGIDTIIKASGIAKMSLYKYYPSKDALVLAYLQTSADCMRNRILTGINDKNFNPQEKILAIFAVFDEMVASPDFRGCPFINAAVEYADVDGPIQQAAADFYREFCHLLTDLARQAGYSEPEELSTQLSILLAGATTREQIHKGSGAMRSAYKVAQILLKINSAEKALTVSGKTPLNRVVINKF